MADEVLKSIGIDNAFSCVVAIALDDGDTGTFDRRLYAELTINGDSCRRRCRLVKSAVERIAAIDLIVVLLLSLESRRRRGVVL